MVGIVIKVQERQDGKLEFASGRLNPMKKTWTKDQLLAKGVGDVRTVVKNAEALTNNVVGVTSATYLEDVVNELNKS